MEWIHEGIFLNSEESVIRHTLFCKQYTKYIYQNLNTYSFVYYNYIYFIFI